MQIFKGKSGVNKLATEAFALSIGNFDGVHEGHQFLIKSIKEEISEDHLKLMLVTFRPHPKFILKPESCHFLINTYDERTELLKDTGVDYLWELDLTRDFSTQTPISFLSEYILNLSGLKKIFLGHDFQFGANKAGDFDVVKTACEDKGIEVIQWTELKSLPNTRTSSSEIRSLISRGDIKTANQLLGRNFYITGLVFKGEGRGKTIGFPTANTKITKERVIPENGVYITKTHCKGLVYMSVTNIGYKPTFGDDYEKTVETYLLDFDKDIYGENLRVEFIAKLRDEAKFSTVNDLISQISKDVESCRQFYAEQN